ncbi:hypothetical protein [Mycobacterium sp. 236(2023)]|uniref:hypothetical protein n=1 Tax=Mycobacterium sp. 236(2023) TaxID=3038163 RepID=UPI002414FC05|nr:hypothetical protein [Mycobacterium sp. 236(2023)]MDG4666063.1 hypothetical protein [Mycobacterium sp. 236(2023)]
MVLPVWTTFWPDVIVAAIGAALTVAIAVVTYVLNRLRNEGRALKALILDLSHRRVFTGQAVTIPDAQETGDYRRCNDSVIAAREEIRRARGLVREEPSLQLPLKRMTQACNFYLEASERDPNTYAIRLVQLGDELHEEIRKLASRRRGLPTPKPGSDAFPNDGPPPVR